MGTSCYSITGDKTRWFWAVWHDIGCCWFSDTEPFAYGRARTREQAIADAEEAIGITAVLTDECFAAEWKAIIDRRRHQAQVARFAANHQPHTHQDTAVSNKFKKGDRQNTWRKHLPKEIPDAHLRQLEQKYAEQLQLFALTLPFTTQQLSEAYRKLARETHPDAGGNAEAFLAIFNAYQLLKEIAEQGIA
ncbi:MAG: hypothetical protein Kow00121_34250 [Elainellaceae cyanobacterium]